MNRYQTWIKTHLFNGPIHSCITILLLFVVFKFFYHFLDWSLLNSTWSGTAADCRERSGACWAFIREKMSFILFGRYPEESRWRAITLITSFLGLFLISQCKRFWSRSLICAWIFLPFLGVLLMKGGFLGLAQVQTEIIGGLPLTLILSLIGIVFSYPLGILLALGRRSEMPLIKILSTFYIEFIRGIPLISILFMASLMFPLFLPDGMSIDKILRAQAAIILFSAAYMAEVVRGGLQAIPKGQYEAAEALGMNYVQMMYLVILPQALKIVIPPTVNTFISLFKDTSLVFIISLADLMYTTKQSFTDSYWLGFTVEGYIFIAFIYFVFCFFMGQVGHRIEKELSL